MKKLILFMFVIGLAIAGYVNLVYAVGSVDSPGKPPVDCRIHTC